MAAIPDMGSREPFNASKPAGHASNGITPGSSGRLLRGSGSIGGAQEAGHQPTKVPHPHGPYVGRDGQRFRIASK